MNYFVAFVISLVIMSVVASDAEEILAFEPTQVKIQSDIPGESIKAHCYAGDSGTDFGNKVMNYGQSFIFRFRNKPFGITKFYCDFNTKHGSGNYAVFDKRVSDTWCGFACAWYVRKDGPCVIESSAGKSICQSWKQPAAVV